MGILLQRTLTLPFIICGCNFIFESFVIQEWVMGKESQTKTLFSEYCKDGGMPNWDMNLLQNYFILVRPHFNWTDFPTPRPDTFCTQMGSLVSPTPFCSLLLSPCLFLFSALLFFSHLSSLTLRYLILMSTWSEATRLLQWPLAVLLKILQKSPKGREMLSPFISSPGEGGRSRP